MLKVYGIKNCDTVRKALKWLTAEGISHEFQDFRADPVNIDTIAKWDAALGRDRLVNKRGTTYRQQDDDIKEALAGATPYEILSETPTLMKRPVFEFGDQICVGFTDTEKALLK
jgi:Spx/MgsR family transcriptional regulator